MESVWLRRAGRARSRTARRLRRAAALAGAAGATRSRSMKDTTVIYNGACPVCSREIGVYRARAEGPVTFVDLNETDLGRFGLTPDAAARRLHVVEDGRLLAGVDAFRALWRATPGFRWLATVAGWPGVRQAAGAVYDRVLAPALYRRHVRRMRRRCA
jgi:predicted DCC family thiol-disulfide oxidoreductase YuxK